MTESISTPNIPFGVIADTGVVPVRKTPDERAEMVNQLLYGDLATVISQNEEWIEIKSVDDDYPGWVSKKMLTLLDSDTFNFLQERKKVFLTNIFNYIDTKAQGEIVVPAGAVLYCSHNNNDCINGEIINTNEQNLPPDRTEKIISLGKKFLGAPYLWGGKTMFGMDCSGLVQVLFRIAGISLPRDASQQATNGQTLNFIKEVSAGDLAFFDNEEENITHVGIFTGPGELLHASGRVRLDSIDHQGIYNKQESRYTHKLRLIKRVI